MGSYQHRILDLEIELQHMGREGKMSTRAYKKRLLALSQLQERLDLLAQNARPSPTRPLQQFNDLPPALLCTPEELELCQRYLASSAAFLKKLKASAASLWDWVKNPEGSAFSWPLATTFKLSRLRARLVALDQELSELRQGRKLWDSSIEAVLTASQLLGPQHQKKPSIHRLQTLFYQLDELSKQILSLRLTLEKEERELLWMDKWLRLQELTLAQQRMGLKP